MKIINKNILILLLLSVSVEARNFKILANENGIDTNFPFQTGENNNTKLEIGYYRNKNDKVEDFTLTNREGKKATKIDENNIFMSVSYNIAKINNINIFLGLEYESFKRDKEQLGYYKKNNDYIPYNHTIKLTGKKFNLLSEATYTSVNDYDSRFKAYLRATVTPQTKLEIKQSTKIFPTPSTGGELESDSTLDLSYMIEGELLWEVGEAFDIGIGGSYGFVPYEYKLKVLNNKKDGYIQKNQSFDEDTTEYFIKVHIKKWLPADIQPTIGYRKIKVKKEGMHSVDRNFVFAGVEKWF